MRINPQVSTFRVGLVGAGYVSEFHVKALQRLPEVRIVGITDLAPDRARAVASRFGITAYPSLGAMAAAGLDVVHVLTPPSSHTAVALEALELGAPVLVEKPLATNVGEGERMAVTCEEGCRRVIVIHTILYATVSMD